MTCSRVVYVLLFELLRITRNDKTTKSHNIQRYNARVYSSCTKKKKSRNVMIFIDTNLFLSYRRIERTHYVVYDMKIIFLCKFNSIIAKNLISHCYDMIIFSKLKIFTFNYILTMRFRKHAYFIFFCQKSRLMKNN